MRRPLKIAVVSDNHIDTDVEPDSWELAKTAFKKMAAAKVDHIIVAGDLFDCATAMNRDRDQVERFLRRLGLWHRDRLSIVVGNHDIFHTPHHGSIIQRGWEIKNILSSAGQENYEAFTEWAGDVVNARDRLDGDDDLYPFQKLFGDVRLWAVDTTSPMTDTSGNGFWPEKDDALLRGASKRSREGERRILAMHNTPVQDKLQTITNFLRGEYSFGFPPQEFSRPPLLRPLGGSGRGAAEMEDGAGVTRGLEALRKSFETKPTRTAAEAARFGERYPKLAVLVRRSWVSPGLNSGFVPQGLTWLPGNHQAALTFHDPESTLPSRLVIVDLATGSVVKDVDILDHHGEVYRGHAGGIVVLGAHLFICSEGVLRFELDEAVNPSTKPLRATGHFLPDSRGSFMTSNGNHLWIGEFFLPSAPSKYPVAKHHVCSADPTKRAWVAGYHMGDDGTPLTRARYEVGGRSVIKPDRVLFTRGKVQGVAICSEIVALSVSYGPDDSKLALYDSPFATPSFEVKVPGGTTAGFVVNDDNHVGTVAMPAGSQNLGWNGRNLLVAFEGGCDAYRERWRSEGAGIEDRILELAVPAQR